ncbi:phosphonate ABC transporter ATP-binding protein [Aurantimonas sp. VKM B-3413]|uniref:phosphonate ABC transporter ATP-binding protein n=1 Tax=Aurantimonas sp. VKM B-3413 TaxID=2779401 RepID=UPI001E3A039A|nr:phosphonate ABC transporter ATP-binding protein [Aurantimonas sp. VKM B-3413]MCB8838896.1 phosphonate ABC transporter ATP-binding protein [Aurantimonas sp. VKM B-3413]
MLKLENVSRRFATFTAVNGVTLSIPAGQMVGVIGRSGAGKSTLLRMLNRLIDPSGGRIGFGETDVTALRGAKLRRWQRDCAMIFQQFNLVPRIDVLTNVLLGRLNHRNTVLNLLGIFSDEERVKALAALDRLGIAQTALQMAGTLSGGQQQRVAIARALMQEPKVILADEPIASLDPLNAEIVMDALRDINEKEGITVITNLHTLDTARAYCERIVGLAAGEVVFDGAPEALTSDVVRRIYGADDKALSEHITSTSISRPRAEAAQAPQRFRPVLEAG